MMEKQTFAVIDTETTGMDDTDELIEFALVPVIHRDGEFNALMGASNLARPSVPIQIPAMAVHHITESDLEDVLLDPEGAVKRTLNSIYPVDPGIKAIVAHNAEFDKRYCAEYMPEGVPWICTYKVALRLWPDAPSHKNASLFYYNEIHKTDPEYWSNFFKASQLHRALPDAMLTAHLFGLMLDLISADKMIQISSEPGLLPKVPFGKHFGKKWSEVDYGYLKWVLGQDFSKDVIYTVKTEMKQRSYT